MGQTTIVLMIITVLSKIFGFVRESVMAAFIGAGELKSIYTTAMTIPNVFTWIVSAGIISGYIPIYNKVKNENGEEKAVEFTSNLINIFMVYSLIIFIIVFIFARPLSKLFSPDLTGSQLDLAVNYTRIMIFAIFAFLYSSVMKGYLNIKGNFIDPIITGFILNFFTISATILTAKYENPYILIIGALIANIIQYVRYPFAAKKLGFKYKKLLDFKDHYIKSLMILVVPIMLSSAADQISILIDNSMASAFFGVSSVSKIFYSKTMLNFIMGVVTMSVTTVTFPEIAKLGQAGMIEDMKDKVGSSIVYAMILVIPATLGMMALSEPIIKLAFERNAFTPEDTYIVSSLLVSYGPYIIFTSIVKILSNGFYSVGNSKIPVLVVLFQQVINFIMNIILSKFYGINGIAYSTSISTAISSILLVILFNKKFGRSNSRDNIISVIKIFISSLIMAIIANCSFNVIKYNIILSILISVIASGFIYYILLKILKLKEFEVIKNILKNKINKSRKEAQ